ncbi:wax ester/triacylglycerol synthase family O-acyltransferase [Amycolatopsis alkalitolerans]|uniref:Diacylglycerol O-acyltransferase n=1 Tax=Amycolatopsis alkalitolerans TaxID=2547244 RepID=A0A5C4LUY9_9PSEU|nr:wax ester/triacylglycerol synthase family O-acyltransferase [Amycolatopsis alkalitolerans]TNC19340.1 wax ester/triacylglycerol synthase family O-acyltransferase [Amycolatopsis alkalitolerans]
MEPLSALDAAFLEIEDEDPSAALAIASVAVAEGPPPPQEEFVAAYSALLPSIPRYRQRVRHVPLDLGPPLWVDDADFDPRRHFQRVAAAAPGDEAALCELVGMIMSERLDRGRPLWECWVIEGLENDRWAVVSKLHHCLADGVSGVTLHDLFFHDAPPAPAPQPPAEPEPSLLALLGMSLRQQLATGPFGELRTVARGLADPRTFARWASDAARGLAALASALIPVTPSSLSGPIGRRRHYELAQADLPTVAGIAKAFDATVNDVVLAAISGALREVLLDRGEEPAADSVRALVPVNVRSGPSALDNQVSLMLPLLPVDVADPALRLVSVHRRLAGLKDRKEAEAGAAVTTAAGHGPFAPVAWAIRAAAKLPQRNIVTVTTNVPGPRHKLSMLGREIVALHPYVPIALRLRTGVAILTYQDKLSFGITTDADSAPKTRLLAETIEHELAALAGAAAHRG